MLRLRRRIPHRRGVGVPAEPAPEPGLARRIPHLTARDTAVIPSGRPRPEVRLVAAVDGTAPEVARDPHTAGRLAYTPMKVLHRSLRNHQAGFNQALATALRWHKDHWSREESQAIDATGLIALAPLALACIAHDAGIPIEVESDYVPAALLRRTWCGELDA
ncbi:Imm49 family immunity protein [Streptomyces erythrochromogenes]|uniref:Imm49 family immunity protein n=1 Tax=Streptomyces erythrochromogenes TaxID=285574 RepID=UPI0036B16DFF